MYAYEKNTEAEAENNKEKRQTDDGDDDYECGYKAKGIPNCKVKNSYERLDKDIK